MRLLSVLAVFLLFNSSTLFSQEKATQDITSKYFTNLHQLNDSVYRSEQPNVKGFQSLEEQGIKTVISFRRHREDYGKTKNTELKLVQIPLKASELTEADLIHTLQVIQAVEKPVLIHCWKGSDRTGAISATYRVVFEGWSKEQAVKELRFPEYGYNEKLYPNVVNLIMNLNTEKMKRELGIH